MHNNEHAFRHRERASSLLSRTRASSLPVSFRPCSTFSRKLLPSCGGENQPFERHLTSIGFSPLVARVSTRVVAAKRTCKGNARKRRHVRCLKKRRGLVRLGIRRRTIEPSEVISGKSRKVRCFLSTVEFR